MHKAVFIVAATNVACVDGLLLASAPRVNATGTPLRLEHEEPHNHGLSANASKTRGSNATNAAFVQLNKQVPTVRHQKEAGNGYLKGSPLYDHQEARKGQESSSVGVQRDPVLNAFQPWWSAEEGIGGSIVYVLFIFLVAYLYRQHQVNDQGIHTEVAPFQGDSFTHGFCDLCHKDDGRMLFWACCCPGIRWADTVSNIKVRFLKFWAALAVFVALMVLSSGLRATEIGGVFGIALLATGVYYRQRLRGVFGHARGTVKTIALDIMAWACCPCCAIVQEAKEVEYCFIK